MAQPLNIMLLVGEDTGRHQSCYGEPYAHTPHIDRLAAEGCRYTQAFTTSPVCAPSRSGLVTGRYPWSIGTHLMRCRLFNPPRLFTHELRDAGYEVHWPTKADFNFEPPADFAHTDTNWLEDGQLPDGPFFVYQNFGVTHESTVWDVGPHDGLTFEQRTAELTDDQRHDPADAPVPPYLPDIPAVRRDIARYFDNLALQDRGVGQALELLERSGQADNTLVIYITDHGRGLPREKRWCYDAGLRLPLIVRWPGGLQAGSVDHRLVSWIDLAPTLLSLVGAEIPESYEGQVFLGDAAAAARDHVLVGRDRMDEQFDRVRGLRTARFHYLRNDFPELPYMQRNAYMEQGPTAKALRHAREHHTLTASQEPFMAHTKPAEELYDVAADPHQLINLAGQSDYRADLERLRSWLSRRLESTGDLGEVSEEVLIERRLIADQLADLHARAARLPPHQRFDDKHPAITQREAGAQLHCPID